MSNLPEVKTTTDHSIFKYVRGNRKICRGHFLNLKKSIESQNDLPSHPILVTEDMEVIDGQHRLEVAKSLSLPIFYIVKKNNDISLIPLLNAVQKQWLLEDFLNFYCEVEKNPHYLSLRQKLKEYGLNFTPMFGIIIDHLNFQHARNAFKMGKFEWTEKEEKKLKDAMTFKEKLTSDSGLRFTKNLNQSFYAALGIFFSNPNINPEWFYQQLEKYSFLLEYQPSKDRYLEMLFRIYNYKSRNAVPMPGSE